MSENSLQTVARVGMNVTVAACAAGAAYDFFSPGNDKATYGDNIYFKQCCAKHEEDYAKLMETFRMLRPKMEAALAQKVEDDYYIRSVQCVLDDLGTITPWVPPHMISADKRRLLAEIAAWANEQKTVWKKILKVRNKANRIYQAGLLRAMGKSTWEANRAYYDMIVGKIFLYGTLAGIGGILFDAWIKYLIYG